MKKTISTVTILLCALVLIVTCDNSQANSIVKTSSQTVQTAITENGQALLPIVISANASDASKKAAHTLADYLHKITGATFSVKSGTGAKGLVVGTIDEFPKLKGSLSFSRLLNEEDYILRSFKGGVYFIGTTEHGVSHAVWDFLHRIGYRRYFPNPHWQIIPDKPNLSIAVNVHGHPSFFWRALGINATKWYKPTPQWRYQPAAVKYSNMLKERQSTWRSANRINIAHGNLVQWGHSWNKIFKAKKAQFEKHPNYYKWMHGRVKFNIGNPGLRKLVVKYALDYFKKHPEKMCVSIEPSDSKYWYDSAESKKIGSSSDQMVFLANQVIDAVRAKYPDKYVSFLAYSTHSDPPTLQLHPGVIVGLTTALTRGKVKSFDKRIQGWRKHGAIIGVYRYLGLWIWDYGTPHMAKVSKLKALSRMLVKYHKMGIRIFYGEASGSWAGKGLGYYVASRILWNINSANHVDDIVDDFINNCFPGVQKSMRKFYGLLNGAYGTTVPPFSNQYLRKLYALINQAWNQTDNKKVKARLSDLVLYLHYLDMMQDHLTIDNPAKRQKSFNKIIRYAYRVYGSQMIQSTFIVRFAYSTKTSPFDYKVPKDMRLTDTWKKYSAGWDKNQPFSDKQIKQFIAQGLRSNSATPPQVKVKVGAAVGVGVKSKYPVSNLSLRQYNVGLNRVLIYPLHDGPVRIDFKDVTAKHYEPTNVVRYSWSIEDAQGKIIRVGQTMRKGQSVVFEAKAKTPYYFFAQGTFALDIKGASSAIQTNLDHGQVHFFRKPVTLYKYIPKGLANWNLQLYTLAPGETAKVTVISPNGKKMALMITKDKKRKVKATFPGEPGFWTIHVGSAKTGILYDYALKFDKRLSPWASLNPNHPLIITDQK